MILEIGGRKLDFGDDNTYKFAFPLSCGKSQLLVNTTIEVIQEDNLLSCYSCGDMLNDIGQLMASTKCTASALNKISMEVFIQREGEEHSEASACAALACQEHTFMTMMQALFVSGMVTTYRVEYMKSKENNDKNNDKNNEDDSDQTEE